MWEVSDAEAFRDDGVAQLYLKSAFQNAGLSPNALLSPREWVRLLYLTDGGRLKVSVPRLARFLDVPYDTAENILSYLDQITRTAPRPCRRR
jgi:hypothetical protein